MSSEQEIITFSDLFDDWVVDEAAKTYSADASYAQGETPIYPRTSINTVLDKMFRKDDKIAASITTKADAIIAAGYKIHGSNSRNVTKAESLISRPLVRQLILNLALYGNGFWEIEKSNSGNIEALHTIETHTLYPVDSQGHGEVDFYKQQLFEPVTLPAEDVFHWRLDRISTSQWAEVPVQPIAQYVALKLFIKNHVTRLFKNNEFRPVTYVKEGLRKEELDRVVSSLMAAKSDPEKPLLNFGDGRTEPLSTFTDGTEFREWINICDNAILTQMQVPPIMAGMPDNSGRASGEQETYKAFNTHIKGIIATIEDEFSRLFEQIGLTGVQIKFGAIDEKSERDLVDVALKLKSMGAKPKKLVEWMNKEGFELDDDFFDESFFESPTKADNNQMTNADPSGSRDSKPQGQMNERVGTGSEGTTRRDQIDEAAIKYQIMDDRVLEKARRWADD